MPLGLARWGTPNLLCVPLGDARLVERMTALVNDLKKVQDALGGGYLSAFPLEHFERLQALRPVWAPFLCGAGSWRRLS